MLIAGPPGRLRFAQGVREEADSLPDRAGSCAVEALGQSGDPAGEFWGALADVRRRQHEVRGHSLEREIDPGPARQAGDPSRDGIERSDVDEAVEPRDSGGYAIAGVGQSNVRRGLAPRCRVAWPADLYSPVQVESLKPAPGVRPRREGG